MLVLSDRMDILDGEALIPHVVRRFAERACVQRHIWRAEDMPLDAAPKLLWIMEEINHYLPADWRMTRSRNNFRLFCSVKTRALTSDFVLCGETVRDRSNHIYHIVHSVYRPEWLDRFDREACLKGLSLTPDDWQKMTPNERDQANDELGRRNPELLRPNLYFVKPAPDDSISPLFARQFEKRQENSRDWQFEFHRIHPLRRAGVDPVHHRWVRWNRQGTMEFASEPHASYRGDSLWLLPRWRDEAVASVEQSYRSLLLEHRVARDAHEWKPMEYETEYKFLCGQQDIDVDTLFHRVIGIVSSAGVRVDSDSSVTQTDLYLDDDSFTLYLVGASLRIRTARGVRRLTFKSRLAEQSSGRPDGPYVRMEEELAISAQDESSLLAGDTPELAPLTLLKRTFPACSTLKPRLQVRNKRRLIVLRNDAGQAAELCLDRVEFLNDIGACVGRDVEIELESRGLAPHDMAALANALTQALPLQPTARSKYERALELVGIG